MILHNDPYVLLMFVSLYVCARLILASCVKLLSCLLMLIEREILNGFVTSSRPAASLTRFIWVEALKSLYAICKSVNQNLTWQLGANVRS